MDNNQKTQGKITAIIPAAGQGSRMKSGINKQYLTLRGKPILSYTLDAFEDNPLIDKIVLIINPYEIEVLKKEILSLRKYKKIKLAKGGENRQASVYSGLRQCDKDTQIVLIHDGARPIISQNLINKCIYETLKDKATVVAVPAKNTIKVVNQKGFVEYTPDRSSLYEIQTPQSFEYDLILKAHEQALKEQFVGSDDASLVERIHVPVKIITGQYSNIKITTPEDLIIAESIITINR